MRGERRQRAELREEREQGAESAAWDAFYRSGKIEDYIRYAQWKARARSSGETDDDEDERTYY